MGITTNTYTTVGVKTPFTYTPGGDGTVIVNGSNLAVAILQYSLDGTNYQEAGRVERSGGFNFRLPACDLRWEILIKDPAVAMNVVASVENI